MKIKLSKKQRQFLINSFIICSLLSFVTILILKLLLPNKSSQDIASTVGGILGTTFSFFGSVLVYFALKAQIEANEQVRKQFEKQEETEYFRNKINFVNEKINTLREEVNNFVYVYKDESVKGSPLHIEYKGSQAFHVLLSKNVDTFKGKSKKNSFELQPKFHELYRLLLFIRDTVSIIEIEQFDRIPNKSDQIKLELYSTLNYFYSTKLKWNFKSVENFESKHNGDCSHECGYNHGLPSELFEVVRIINEKLEPINNETRTVRKNRFTQLLEERSY